MASTISPNMNLVVPTVGSEPDPDWANDLNADLSILDSHNHSTGQGVQIQPSGININSDLTFGGNNATNLKAARFQSQTSPITNSGSAVGEIYVSGNELYYNDYTGGNQVQITNNGSVNAGAGSITGLPSGTASVSFSASTYTFQSATATAGNIDGRSVVLRNAAASSKGLTLNPPSSMAADISQTLPAIPASQSFMAIDTSGNMSGYAAVSGGITGSMIASATVTGTNIASATVTGTNIASATVVQSNLAARAASATATAGQVAVSTGSGSFTTSSSAFVDVTGTTVTLVTTGRPVYIMLQSTAGSSGTIDSIHANMQFLVNGVAYGITSLEINPPTDIQFPPGMVHCLVTGLAATTYTIKLQVNKGSSATSTGVNNVTLVAWEI